MAPAVFGNEQLFVPAGYRVEELLRSKAFGTHRADEDGYRYFGRMVAYMVARQTVFAKVLSGRKTDDSVYQVGLLRRDDYGKRRRVGTSHQDDLTPGVFFLRVLNRGNNILFRVGVPRVLPVFRRFHEGFVVDHVDFAAGPLIDRKTVVPKTVQPGRDLFVFSPAPSRAMAEHEEQCLFFVEHVKIGGHRDAVPAFKRNFRRYFFFCSA